jgi:hypothetical protein
MLFSGSTHTSVFSVYGNTEHCAMAMEGEHVELHFQMTHSFVEIRLGNGFPCQDGAAGSGSLE